MTPEDEKAIRALCSVHEKDGVPLGDLAGILIRGDVSRGVAADVVRFVVALHDHTCERAAALLAAATLVLTGHAVPAPAEKKGH